MVTRRLIYGPRSDVYLAWIADSVRSFSRHEVPTAVTTQSYLQLLNTAH